MIKAILFIACLSCASLLQAQDSWVVKLNKKVVLSASKEDETRNTIKLYDKEWKKRDCLRVIYKQEVADTLLARSILFFDENDYELIRKDDIMKVEIPMTELKKIFFGKKKIRIFTTVRSTDPEVAARARFRRVHLCTIEWQ